MSVPLRGIGTILLALVLGTGLVAQTAIVQPAYATDTRDPALPEDEGSEVVPGGYNNQGETESGDTADPGDGAEANTDDGAADEETSAVEDTDATEEPLEKEALVEPVPEETETATTKNDDEAASSENQSLTNSKLPEMVADPNDKGDVEVPTVSAAAATVGLPSMGFKAGNIISDANMYNGTAMTASQIQTFLNQQVSRCTIGDPGRKAGSTWQTTKIATHCLKDLKVKTQSRAASSFCKAYKGATSETAAQIIAKVGAACGISPKVLLVRLQLEQSLVLDTWPTVRQYSFAMGWECPDSGPGNSANCNNGSAGFLDQVYGSAWQVKRYKALPNEYRYKAHQTNSIQWHPNVSCGASNVYIENSATAALYIYTPYRPNQSALNAGWAASSNSCATYGNRNFYQYYRAWFGSPNTFFSDVQSSHQFFKEIEWMGESGISTGMKMSGGRSPAYEPNLPVSRAAMAAFLYRSQKATYKGPKVSPFADMEAGDKFYDEVAWMHKMGYSAGIKQPSGKPKFGPNMHISRSSISAFMYRIKNETYKGPARSPYSDIKQGDKFYNEMAWMSVKGISKGMRQPDGSVAFSPDEKNTRQGMAAFLHRLDSVKPVRK